MERRNRNGGHRREDPDLGYGVQGNQSNVSDASTGLPVGQNASISWGMADSSRLRRRVRAGCAASEFSLSGYSDTVPRVIEKPIGIFFWPCTSRRAGQPDGALHF